MRTPALVPPAVRELTEHTRMSERKKLSDILRGSTGSWIQGDWSKVRAAPERKPVPPAEYVCLIIDGRLDNARVRGTPDYKLTLEIAEGEFIGRHLWYDVWLTDRNRENAKRDLEKLGVQGPEQLETPLPPGIKVRAKVVNHREDSGDERNVVRWFEVIGVEQPAPDPYAPRDDPPATESRAGGGSDGPTPTEPDEAAARNGRPGVKGGTGRGRH
jgi:hypothetical protein